MIGGLALFVTGAGQVWYEGVAGDPPSGRAFRAYHYMAALGVIGGILWLALLMRCCWSRHLWWMIVVAAVWFGLMAWLCVENLIDVHRHPAGEYYWDMWMGSSSPGR